MLTTTVFTVALVVALEAFAINAFDVSGDSNLVLYWGQGPAQERLSYFCNDDTVDVIPIGFVNSFPTNDSPVPGSNFGNACGVYYKTSSNKTTKFLSPCPEIANDVKYCQSRGKKILLSLGGDTQYNLPQDQTAVSSFADYLWGAFGPVTWSWTNNDGPRPFGDAVVDGFDFDIESGSDAGYSVMVDRFRELFALDVGHTYYISGTPQCTIPDPYLGSAISNSYFDYITVQFYNTPPCSARAGLDHSFGGVNTDVSFDQWVAFVKQSKNPGARVYLGLPASPSALVDSRMYLAPCEVQQLIERFQGSFNFGGVMLWEATYSNNNQINGQSYAQIIKSILQGGSCNATSSTTTTSIVTSTTSSAVSSATSVTATTVNSTTIMTSSSSKILSTLSTVASGPSSTSVPSSVVSTSSAPTSSTSSTGITSSVSSSSNSTSSTNLPSSSFASSSSAPSNRTSLSSASSISTMSSSSASSSTFSTLVSGTYSAESSSTSMGGYMTSTSSATSTSTLSSTSAPNQSTSPLSSSLFTGSPTVIQPTTVSLSSLQSSLSASSAINSTTSLLSTSKTAKPSDPSISSIIWSPTYSASASSFGSGGAGSPSSAQTSTASLSKSSSAGLYGGSLSSSAPFSSTASIYTTSSVSGSPSESATSTNNVSSPASSISMTTSIIYSTTTITITSCAPTITDCPADSSRTITSVISVTTVVPCSLSRPILTPSASPSTIYVVPIGSSSAQDYDPSTESPSSVIPTSAPYLPTAPSSDITATVITTQYVDICPDGFTTVPYTYTATISPSVGATDGASPSSTSVDPVQVPSGFTTTVTVCTVCGAQPTTVTLTKPIASASAAPAPVSLDPKAGFTTTTIVSGATMTKTVKPNATSSALSTPSSSSVLVSSSSSPTSALSSVSIRANSTLPSSLPASGPAAPTQTASQAQPSSIVLHNAGEPATSTRATSTLAVASSGLKTANPAAGTGAANPAASGSATRSAVGNAKSSPVQFLGAAAKSERLGLGSIVLASLLMGLIML